MNETAGAPPANLAPMVKSARVAGGPLLAQNLWSVTMTVDPANANELAKIAGEVGADLLKGDLSYLSETGGWHLGAC